MLLSAAGFLDRNCYDHWPYNCNTPFSTCRSSLINGQTSSVYTTATSTLTGPCATNIQYPGAHAIVPYQDPVFIANTTYPTPLSNSYDCCVRCQNIIKGFCLAYFNVPGVGCTILQAYLEASDVCSYDALVYISSSLPNNLGGNGPCARTVTTTMA